MLKVLWPKPDQIFIEFLHVDKYLERSTAVLSPLQKQILFETCKMIFDT